MSDTQNAATFQECLNTESVTIKPDVRVAYAQGLVLGVDEFVQEQRYFLEKDYLHNRSLHGYGTVYGLSVDIAKSETGDLVTERPVTLNANNTNEAFWLRIGPGVGVDQGGRTFVLRETYCINLSSWWATYADKDKVKRSKDGKSASIYIRARYDERCGDLTAIAGQACSTDEMTSVNSRIYDSVILELGSVIPTMSAWDLSRRFAWLMAQIRIVPGITFDADSGKALIKYVQNWLGETTFDTQFNTELDNVENRTTHRYFQFPEGSTDTQNLLDALSTAFVTNVAPKGYHDLDPYSTLEDTDYDILLAEIILGGTANDSSITSVDANESQRPYLLGTQVFQELLNISKHDKNRRRLFASLHVESPTSLLLWIHQPLYLAANALEKKQLVLKRDGGELTGTVAKAGDLYRITLSTTDPHNIISVGSPIELSFNLNTLTDQTGKPLDISRFNEYVGLNEDGTLITINTFADNLPAVRSLAAVNVARDSNDTFVLDIGFNIGTAIALTGNSALQIFKDNDLTTAINASRLPDSAGLLHFQLSNTIQDNDLLTLRFDVDLITADTKKLSAWMSDGQFTFVGYDGQHYVNLTYVINAPPEYTDQKVSNVLKNTIDSYLTPFKQKNIDPLQIRPFATITPQVLTLADNVSTQIYFEIWLHLSLLANANNASETITLSATKALTNLQIFAEQGSNAGTTAAPVTIGSIAPKPNYNNVINVFPQDQTGTADFNYLRFVFLVDQINLATTPPTTLKKFIEQNHIKFEGSYLASTAGPDSIVIFVRNPLVPKPPPPQPNINKLAAAAPKAEAVVAEEAAPVEAAPKPRTRRAGGKS